MESFPLNFWRMELKMIWDYREGFKKGHLRASADKAVPCGVGSGALLLPRSVDVNQGEVLHDLLHLLELEQGGEAALTCRGRGGGQKRAVNGTRRCEGGRRRR